MATQKPPGYNNYGAPIGTPPPPFDPLRFFQQVMAGFYNKPVAQAPDYTSLINQYMGPWQKLYEQQIANLESNQSTARSLAEKNAELAKERLNIAHNDAVLAIQHALGAQGLTDSGDMGYRMHRENKLYNNALSMNANSLASYLNNLAQQMQSQQLAGQQQLQSERQSLLPWLAQNYPATTTYPNRWGYMPAAPAQSTPFSTIAGGWS